MKSWLPVRIVARPRPPALLVLMVLAIVDTPQTGCTGSRLDPAPTPAQRLQEAIKGSAALRQAQTLPKASSGPGLQCPLLNASMVLPTPPANGGHRVTLSWKASAPADSKHSGAVGYCVYRGAPGDPNPGLINSVPLPGISCVDDVVANGQRYSYVVRAISANGVTSITSNPVPVEIPATGRSTAPISAPLCRGAVGVK